MKRDPLRGYSESRFTDYEFTSVNREPLHRTVELRIALDRLIHAEIKSDLCVNAIVCDFAVVYFCGEFLDVKRANVPQCFRTSSTAPCAASSKLFGDCDISSMTLTTLAMGISSPFSIYRRWRGTSAFFHRNIST